MKTKNTSSTSRAAIYIFSFLLLSTGLLNAQTVNWMGINWNSYGSPTFNVNSSGQLEVTSGNDYGAAHYNTPSLFRASTTPCVEVSFIDNLTGRIQLWMEDENYVTPNGGAWTQFGAWETSSNYQIYWWDYDTYLTNSSTGFGFVDTGIQRTTGEHTLKIGMGDNGLVDYYIDGALVHSGLITPNYFGDIYLASQNTTGVFTNYQTSTIYTPIPEPGTVILLGIGLLGLGVFGRFRRQNRTYSSANWN